MRESQFDEIVTGLYQAAAGDGTWTQPLDLVADMFGARLAGIHRVDLHDQRLLAQESGGITQIEDGVLQYVREYHQLDPRRAQVLAGVVPPGTWYHDHEHLNNDFVAADTFYQHFVAAYGSRYFCALAMAPAPDQAVLFGMELPPQRGPLDPDERYMIGRIGGHVEEALRAFERVRRLQAQCLAGHQLLQTFDQPMWLIDLDRYVHDANTAAGEEARTGRVLIQRGSHLAAGTSRLDRELLGALQALRGMQHGSSRVLQQQVPGELQPLWLHLSLLQPQETMGAFGVLPMVLVTLFDPGQVRVFDPFALASFLGLTPAQARVAAGLAEGRTPEDIASTGGTSLATIRSHIHNVLQRTGASRAEELVLRLHDGHALWKTPFPRGQGN